MGEPARPTEIRDLPVVELFGPTLNGEGAQTGLKSAFLRLAYCDYRCQWCDTMYAVDPKFKGEWVWCATDDIVRRLCKIGTTWVTITGGNPAIHDLSILVGRLHKVKKRVNLETQGSIPRNWFASCDMVTLSPKPPSSGVETNWDKLDECVNLSRRAVLKVVVDGFADLHYAKKVFARYPYVDAKYIQACTHATDDLEALVNKWRSLTDIVLRDSRFDDVFVLPQIHVMLWGRRRGV